jgi:competence protein ComGC
MWLLILAFFTIVCILVILALPLIKKEYARLIIEENEKACYIAEKLMESQIVSHIHPDSEHGKLLKRLDELMILSEEKGYKALAILSFSEDKKQIKLAGEMTRELRRFTREMIEIMEKVTNGPLYEINAL